MKKRRSWDDTVYYVMRISDRAYHIWHGRLLDIEAVGGGRKQAVSEWKLKVVDWAVPQLILRLEIDG